MNKYEITKRIEDFAPPETQEDWDCSGWAVNVEGYDEINKIMLCLTVTNDVVRQAREENCDMIVSHHPCFYVPLDWSFVNIYCAHTNMDKAQGGTTDTLIESLYKNGLPRAKALAMTNCCHCEPGESIQNFVRIISLVNPILISDFSKIIKQISPNARLINNNKVTMLNKIAFCAGSGSDLINYAIELGADCLVTGDLKFHTALESSIVIYDIGHFESEILILPVFENIIGNNNVKIVYADEHSPFNLI